MVVDDERNELDRSVAGMTITEWCNDDRLLGDLGGGQSTRMAKKWMNEMGFTWKQIPNMEAHSQADEKHSDMFLPFLKEYATGEKEQRAIQAAKDSLAFNAMFREGIAKAQEKLSGERAEYCTGERFLAELVLSKPKGSK